MQMQRIEGERCLAHGGLHSESFHLPLQKAPINQRELEDQYKGAGTSGEGCVRVESDA